MKKWILQIIGIVLVLGAIGVCSYVAAKKVLGSFILSGAGTIEQQLDEIVGDLERARGDLSRLRDSIGTVETGLLELGSELDKSAELATRLEKRIGASLDRQRELEELFGGAEEAAGVLAEGIGKGEAAINRLRQYLGSDSPEGGP